MLRPFQQDRNDVLRPDAPPHKMTRQAIGPRFELRIGERLALAHQRHRLRRPRHLRFEQSCHRERSVQLHNRTGTAREPRRTRVRTAQRQRSHRRSRIARHALQHTSQRFAPLPDTALVEQVRVILDQPLDRPIGLRRERECHIELGVCQPHRLRLHFQPGKLDPGVFLRLPRKHRLEHRRVRQRALHLQMIHQPLERQLLVGEYIEHHRARARNQLTNARLPAHVHPKHQRVHEEPHQRLKLGTHPTCHRRANHHIRLPRQPRQNATKAGQKNRVERALLRLREPRQPPS